jgi:hypothetical protein
MKIIDVTRDYHKQIYYENKGYEVEIRNESEKQICKKCENLRNHIQHIIDEDVDFNKIIKKDLKKLSNIEFMETFFKDVQPYLRRLISERPQLITQVNNEKKLQSLANKLNEKVQKKDENKSI